MSKYLHLWGGSGNKSIAREPEKSEALESVEGRDRDVGDPAIVEVERVEVRDRGKGTRGKSLKYKIVIVFKLIVDT